MALSLQSNSLSISDLIKSGDCEGIETFSFSKDRILDWEKSSLEDLQKLLKNMTNVKSLQIDATTFNATFFKDVLAPVLINLKCLETFMYQGSFFDLRHPNFSASTLPNQLLSLKLDITDVETNFDAQVKFGSYLKTFRNLKEFEYKTDDLRYVNEFIHDLPHNLSTLEKVTFVFGKSEGQRDPREEPKFHLNAYLDWIVSLPQLEELYLSHPFYDCCNCMHLENLKVTNKLKKLTILETTLIYNLSQVEVEYDEDDLTAILNLLLSESLVSLEFSIHMEPFKSKVLNEVEKIILRMKKLESLKLEFWFYILSEQLIYKLEKMLESQQFISEKELKIRYYEIANAKTRSLVMRENEPKGFEGSKVEYIGLDEGVLKST